MRVLVSAASREGSTLEIAEEIAAVLRDRGIDVTVTSPSAVDEVTRYDAAVVGSAVYRGHWLQAGRSLVHRHAAELQRRPVWLFSSGPVGDRNGPLARRLKRPPAEVPELVRLTAAREHRVFGGSLAATAFPRLRRHAGDWRRWEDVDEWAAGIADDLGHTEWFRRLREEAPALPDEGGNRP